MDMGHSIPAYYSSVHHTRIRSNARPPIFFILAVFILGLVGSVSSQAFASDPVSNTSDSLIDSTGSSSTSFVVDEGRKWTEFGFLIDTDFRRIEALQNHAAEILGESSLSSSYSASANSPPYVPSNVRYIISANIGKIPRSYTLLVDTGSSLTWIGAKELYTQTGRRTGYKLTASYGSGSMRGEEWIDSVSLQGDHSIQVPQMTVGVASSTSGLPPELDGILGIGPAKLSGYYDPPKKDKKQQQIPTFTDQLKNNGVINRRIVCMYFVPPRQDSHAYGEMTWGKGDTTKFNGEIIFAPNPGTGRAGLHFGIRQSMTYNGQTLLNNRPGVVDSGTTMLWLHNDAYQKYRTLTGAKFEPETQSLWFTRAQYAALKPLILHIAGKQFTLMPDAQIWPRWRNTAMGGQSDRVYSIIQNLGKLSNDADWNFMIGYTVLLRFYTAYDTDRNGVWFAETQWTKARVN